MKNSEKKKCRIRALIARLIITSLLIISLFSSCTKQEEVPVLLEPVRMSIEYETIDLSGRYDSSVINAEVVAGYDEQFFMRKGTVAEVYCALGDFVQPGQLLMRLDDKADKDSLAAVEERIAATEKLNGFYEEQMGYEIQILELKRKQLTDRHASQKECDLADVEIALLKRELEYETKRRSLSLDVLRKERQNCLDQVFGYELYASFAGEITMLAAVGDAVSEQTAVVGITNSDDLTIRAPYMTERELQAYEVQKALIEGKEYQIRYRKYTTEEMNTLMYNGTGLVSHFVIEGDRSSVHAGSLCTIVLKKPAEGGIVSLPVRTLTGQERQVKTETAVVEDLVVREQVNASFYPVSEDVFFTGAKAGTLGKVYVRSFRWIKKGEALFDVIFESDKAEKLQRELQLLEAEETFSNTKSEYDKGIAEKLAAVSAMKSGTAREISSLELKKQVSVYNQYVFEAQNAIDAMAKDVNERMFSEVERCTVVAPADGYTDLSGMPSIGSVVRDGTKLCSIFSLSENTIYFSNRSDRLVYGMKVSVSKRSSDSGTEKEYEGRVIYTDLKMNAASEDLYCMAQIEQFEGKADPSTSMSVSYVTKEYRNVVTVCEEAVTFADQDSYVMILEDGKIKKRFVSIGATVDGRTWILEGIEEGTEVCIGL